MTEEHLFHVEGSAATPAAPMSLADAGLREREHLQEWVLASPEIIGDDVLIVTSEFDRWLPSAVSSGGRAPRDRLDVLGIDSAGALVVAELKRDRAVDTVEMQAVKYAAMVAQFTPETLAKAHESHLARRGEQVDADEALARLTDHAGGRLDTKVLRRPRIVLIAGEFLDTTVSSAVWLTQMGVRVDLVRYQAYRTPTGVVISTSRLWPLDEVEDLIVRPEEREEVEEAQRERRRSRSVVLRLIEAGLIEDGRLFHVATNTQASAEIRDEVDEWVAEDPVRGQARWVNTNPRCLVWEIDGKAHSTSGLAETIVAEATGQQIHTTGPVWWADDNGNRLYEILEEHIGEPVYAGFEGDRDWSELHRILEEMPPATWTTYGDVARAIGSSAIAVGQHVTRCGECVNAYRVLSSEGVVSPGFSWDDADRDDDPIDVLQSEGVRFDDRGYADPEQRYVPPPAS